MTVGLLVITDGRSDCLKRTLTSFGAYVDQDRIDRRVIVNDCPENSEFGDWLDHLGFDEHVRPLAQRRGFAGAITAGWDAIGDVDWVFHLEDDFMFIRRIDLTAMTEVLDAHPHIAQMALRRQPWNDAERAAGGYVGVHPEAFWDRHDEAGNVWLEQRLFFTTNPSLYRKSVTEQGWPSGSESEGRFSLRLFEDSQATCGIWGQRTDSPWVIHVGEQRAGIGY